ncbi:hypothetical protein DPMN_068555 [Dreissena polymorpha]|uniref:Secreted protein n=1 Tax=Dreissena polymorpha TaxID=45954 RepID=A0A9D3YXD4_DREPO|nr:hypothetical protein DPMN_068555 [Dreissena polymorpha]
MRKFRHFLLAGVCRSRPLCLLIGTEVLQFLKITSPFLRRRVLKANHARHAKLRQVQGHVHHVWSHDTWKK